jgi:hypothetical protein
MGGYLDSLFQSVFPIVYYDEHDMVKIAGTAILVEHVNHHFLVTAAHVLRDPGSKYQLYVLLQDKAVHLDGPASISRIPENENIPDIDTAYFALDYHPTLMTHLNIYKSITLEEFDEDVNYVRKHYFVFGYPWRRARYNRTDNELSVKPLQYFTDIITDRSLYEKFKRPTESHILVQYKPKSTKNADGKEQLAPHPHGISGGPLFKALVDKNDNVIALILEGLLIEWKESQVIVAVKKIKIRDFLESTKVF